MQIYSIELFCLAVVGSVSKSTDLDVNKPMRNVSPSKDNLLDPLYNCSGPGHFSVSKFHRSLNLVLGLLPMSEDGVSSINCLMINTKDGSCKSFYDPQQACLYNNIVCLDPIFDHFLR